MPPGIIIFLLQIRFPIKPHFYIVFQEHPGPRKAETSSRSWKISHRAGENLGILHPRQLTTCCVCSPGSMKGRDSVHMEAVCCAVYRICNTHSFVLGRVSQGLWDFKSERTFEKVAEHRQLLCKLCYSWCCPMNTGQGLSCSTWNIPAHEQCKAYVLGEHVYAHMRMHAWRMHVLLPVSLGRKTSPPCVTLPQHLLITLKLLCVRLPY